MRVRVFIEPPKEEQRYTPFSGIAYHDNGRLAGRVKIQTNSGDGWEDVEIVWGEE